VVLIGLREFEDSKADIIHKYSTEEARTLQQMGEIPAATRINVTAMERAIEHDGDEAADAGFDFTDLALM
jgi:translation initiation factor 1A